MERLEAQYKIAYGPFIDLEALELELERTNGEVGKYYQASLMLSAIADVPTMLLFWYAAAVLRALGQEENLIPVASRFLQKYMYAIPLYLGLNSTIQIGQK